MALSPKNKQYLTYGACAIGGILLLKMILPKTDTSGSSVDPTNNGGGTLPGYNFNPSVVAERLYDAMKDWGTDEAAIFTALQPVNETMFAQVYAKFGNRSYNTSQGNQITLPFVSLPLHNLRTWLKTELSASDYNTLRLKYPNYL